MKKTAIQKLLEDIEERIRICRQLGRSASTEVSSSIYTAKILTYESFRDALKRVLPIEQKQIEDAFRAATDKVLVGGGEYPSKDGWAEKYKNASDYFTKTYKSENNPFPPNQPLVKEI